jgi:FHS family L-fucose permease-like MFS transporter
MAGATMNLSSTQKIKSSGIPTNYGALSTLVTVFFFWGFIAAGNSVFIPFCKHYFQLDQFQSQLIDFAFYGAYYLGALGFFVYGSFGGKDLVGKWGYKRSIVYGLLFSAIGAAAMIITVNANSFTGMLIGLFIVALGFSLQQTAAQPFAIALGDPSTGTSRVNLGGGINSFGTMIGPIVVALALFGTTAALTEEQIAALTLDKVIMLYIAVGALFIGAAALFYFSKKVPSGIIIEKTEKANKALSTFLVITGLLIVMFTPVFSSYKSDKAKRLETLTAQVAPVEKQIESVRSGNSSGNASVNQLTESIKPQTTEINSLKLDLETYRMKWLFGALAVVVLGLLFSYASAKKKATGWGAMQYPQLVLGMLALFLYVGTEVTIVSNLSELLKQKAFGGFQSSQVAPYISMYWGSMMIGRWVGSISAFEFSSRTKKILMTVVPLVAFAIVIGVNTLAKNDMSPLYAYIGCVLIQIIAFYISKDNPARTLLVFSVLGAIAMMIGVLSTGTLSIYAFLSGGLFCSIMWPCIFALSVAGLGKYESQGSAFLIMMILGGSVIPPLQGKLADYLQSKSSIEGIGIHQSYWIPVFSFIYIAIFAFAVKGILRNQGIDYDNPVEIPATVPGEEVV